MWLAAEASVKLPPPATCQRSKFSATKVLPTHRILPPPSKAPAIRRTTQPSPWLQYGAASLPAPPRLTPPSAAARLHPRLQGSNHLLQPPHTLHQQKNWTVAEIRQVLTSAGVIIPRRSSKSDLLALYNSLQSGEFLNSSPPLESATTASKSRKSPYSRPGPIFTPSRTGLRPPNRSSRPSASLGRAPDTAALSPHLPRASTERQLATQPSKESAFASTSRLTRTSTPPSAAYSYTQPRTTNPSPTHGPQLRHSRPALLHQRKPRRPFTPPPPPPPPPLSPSTKLFQAQTYPNHRPKHQPFPPLFHAVSSVPGAPFSLSTTSPLPIPPNALALEPPPVANSIRSIRSQILSEIQNIGTGGGSTPHPSTSLFRTNIPLKPSLETSPRSLPQFNSPSSLPKDPPVIPDSMEKLQNFSLHL